MRMHGVASNETTQRDAENEIMVNDDFVQLVQKSL